jgi:MFS family permease
MQMRQNRQSVANAVSEITQSRVLAISHRPPTQAFGGRIFQLFLVAAAAWATTFARFTLGPLQEAMRVDLAMSDNQMALLQGPALAVPLALGAIPLGLLVDRYSRVRLFVLFAALTLVASVMTALASSLSVLVAARALLGVAVAGILVAAYSVVADLYPPEQRGRATMVVALGEIGGAPASFAIGGSLLAMANVGPAGWRWALLRMCILLPPVLLLLLLLREPARVGGAVQRAPLGKVWPELWRYRSVLVPLLLARVMVWIADGAVLVWAAPAFARSFALPPDRIGAIVGTALLVSGILGPVLGGPLADLCQRTGGPRCTLVTLGGLALLSAPAALFAVMPSPALAGILLTVFLTIGFTISTAAITFGTIVIPGELRGLYLAVTITGASVFCFGAAPVVISVLSGVLGGPTTIGKALTLVCAATSLLGSAVFIFGRQYFPRTTASVFVVSAD